MTESSVLSLGQSAMGMAFLMAAPVLGVGLVVGLLVSVFQAATQINEMTLSFVPKILAVAVVLAVFSPWMLSTMTAYTANLFSSLGSIAR